MVRNSLKGSSISLDLPLAQSQPWSQAAGKLPCAFSCAANHRANQRANCYAPNGLRFFALSLRLACAFLARNGFQPEVTSIGV
jgi:hypothetical protein